MSVVFLFLFLSNDTALLYFQRAEISSSFSSSQVLLLLHLVRPNFGSEGDVIFCATQIIILVAVWPMTSSN